MLTRGTLAAMSALIAGRMAPAKPETPRLRGLPEGYDPLIVRSGAHSRASSRRKGPRYNVCGCGYRTRRLHLMRMHRVLAFHTGRFCGKAPA